MALAFGKPAACPVPRVPNDGTVYASSAVSFLTVNAMTPTANRPNPRAPATSVRAAPPSALALPHTWRKSTPRRLTCKLARACAGAWAGVAMLANAASGEWQRVYGTAGDDNPTCILSTADGGYLVGGATDMWSQRRSYEVLKIDRYGIRQWEKTYTSIGSDRLDAIAHASEGGYLLVGCSDGMPNVDRGGAKSARQYGRMDFWLVSIDELGAKRWDNSYGGADDDHDAAGVVQTADGGYVIAGLSRSPPSGNKSSPHYGGSDFWLIRVGPQSQLLWDRSFGGTASEGFAGIAPTADGGLLLAGSSNSKADGTKTVPTFGEGDFYVVKVDGQGRQQWDRSYGGAGTDSCAALVARSGGYVLAGVSLSPPSGNRTAPRRGDADCWVVAIDENGNKLWDQSYGGNVSQGLGAALATPDGGLLLAGYSNSRRGGNKTAPWYGAADFWIANTDSAGNLQWDQSFGGSGNEFVRALTAARDGGYILVGISDSPADGTKTEPRLGTLYHDYWLVKIPASVPPRITEQPRSSTVSGGQAVTFSVWALSYSPVRYQWRFNGNELPGETKSTLTLPSARSEQAGRYTVVISNDIGSTESEAAVLHYTDAANLLLTIHPSVTIYGTPGHTYRIEYSEDLGGLPRWNTLGLLTLTNSPQSFVDLSSPVEYRKQRLYRVVFSP